MCNWKSTDNRFKCNRKSLTGSDFCLFHKPDKTVDEANLFWRIINFNNFSQKIYNLRSQFYKAQQENATISKQLKLDLEVENTQNSNFTIEEKQKKNFTSFKREIINLYYESKISGRGNPTLINFNGFVFPKTDFKSHRFDYKYNLATDRTLYFRECVFEGFINFSDYVFLGRTQFENCDFKYIVIFTNAVFKDNVKFINTILNRGYSLNGVEMFQNTKFLGREVVFNNVQRLIEFGSEFSEKTDLQLINMKYPKDFGNASYGEKAYRLAKIQKNRIGDYDSAADYHYLEKCYKGYQIIPEPYFWRKNQKGFKKFQLFNYLFKDKAYKFIFSKIIDLIFKYSIGYGEKPSYAIRTLILLIVGFSFLYMFSGILLQKTEVENELIKYELYFGKDLILISHWTQVIKDFGTSLYFSVVTCTTFGHVEVIPATIWTKIISSIQMFLGITLFGAWTATLLRKFMK